MGGGGGGSSWMIKVPLQTLHSSLLYAHPKLLENNKNLDTISKKNPMVFWT
jgi:hypothetical protein